MNTTAFRRTGAIVGAVVFATTFTISGTTASASTGQQDAANERPCFMIRSHWNSAEGPQPTCPKGRFHTAASDAAEVSRPAPSGRIADFMP